MSDTQEEFRNVAAVPSAAKKKKKSPKKRYPSLSFRVTEAEDARIRGQAKKLGMPLSKFLRTKVLKGTIVIHKQTAYGASLTFEAKRIGVNLNQVMPYIHTREEIPPEFYRACAKLEALLDKLLRAE